MINANELRIGNWVLWEKYYHKVSGDDLAALDDRAHHMSHRMLYSIPINLTTEILEKCGFFEIDDDGGYGHNEYNNLFLENRYLSNDGYDVMLGKKQICLTPIKSLHQLQNLFFSYTKKELI